MFQREGAATIKKLLLNQCFKGHSLPYKNESMLATVYMRKKGESPFSVILTPYIEKNADFKLIKANHMVRTQSLQRCPGANPWQMSPVISQTISGTLRKLTISRRKLGFLGRREVPFSLKSLNPNWVTYFKFCNVVGVQTTWY